MATFSSLTSKRLSKGLSVLHVCKVYLPTKGGVQTVVQRICCGLSASFNNTIITTQHAKNGLTMHDEATIVTARSWGEALSLPLAPGIFFLMREYYKKVHLIVVHYPFPLADLALVLLHIRSTPIIVYWHSEIVSQKLSRKLVAPLTRRLLKQSSAIIVASPNHIKYSSTLNDYREKCRIIPYGYLPNKTYSTSIDRGVFLCIGRHVPYKGFEYLIKALQHCNVQLEIVGKGPLLKQHKQLAKKLGVDDQITFSDNVDDNMLANKLAQCRALVLPSTLPSEAFALVQLEAMALAKPVINTNLKSGVPWVARHKLEALTVAPCDSRELAQALDMLDNDSALRARLGAAAKQRWNDVFNIDDFLNATSDLYQQCISESRLKRDPESLAPSTCS